MLILSICGTFLYFHVCPSLVRFSSDACWILLEGWRGLEEALALASEVMLILSSDGVTGSVTDMEAVGDLVGQIGAEEVLG